MADCWLVESANVCLVGFDIPYQSTHEINMRRIYGFADATDTRQINEPSSYFRRVVDLITGYFPSWLD